jgi:hypothetical protein
MNDVPPPPISPEKAPRQLIIHSPIDNDTLCHLVRRSLFIQKASERYYELLKRDLRMAETRPEQKFAYTHRASQYSNQWFETIVMKGQIKAVISHALRHDKVDAANKQ